MNPAGSVLIDTNVVVAHFRSPAGFAPLIAAAPVIYIPWVVLGELHYGAARSRRPAWQSALIRDFLQSAVLLLPDQTTSELYGQVKAELAAAGTLIPENDIWIAALARQFHLPLATRDAHFASVAHLDILPW